MRLTDIPVRVVETFAVIPIKFQIQIFVIESDVKCQRIYYKYGDECLKGFVILFPQVVG